MATPTFKHRDTKKAPVGSAEYNARLDDFSDRADGGASVSREKITQAKHQDDLNPKAKRDYKYITFPFNQFEFELIAAAAEKENLPKNSFIRSTLMKRATELLG